VTVAANSETTAAIAIVIMIIVTLVCLLFPIS
jgi:hypothetical protein